jgi:hypothetical protein
MLIINDLFKQHKKTKKIRYYYYYYIYTAIKNYKHKLKVL